MNAQVIQMDPIPVVMLRHLGSYDEVDAVFNQLFEWVTANNIPYQRTIGIYWDNPDETPANKLRSAACIEIPSDYQVMDRGGLPLDVSEIAGGTYVTTRFVGPYEDLAPVWTDFTSHIEGNLRRTISQNPAFEVYVNDASTTPPSQLITELYMPVL
jgi:AraC family transcriptional regulator